MGRSDSDERRYGGLTLLWLLLSMLTPATDSVGPGVLAVDDNDDDDDGVDADDVGANPLECIEPTGALPRMLITLNGAQQWSRSDPARDINRGRRWRDESRRRRSRS